MPMTPDDANKLFSPLFPVFWSAIRQAFSRYFEVNQAELGAIHDRTKASYINDLVVKNLKQMIPPSYQAEWESRRGQRRFWLGVACVRAKKVNPNLQSYNLATQAQFDFYDNLINPKFPNMKTATPLVLGYTVNLTKTAPNKLFLICADGVLNHKLSKKLESIKTNIKWSITIPEEESGLPQAISMLPLPELPAPKRVKPKNLKSKKNIKKEE